MSTSRSWQGLLVAAVPTPIDRQGNLDEDGLRHLVSRMSGAPVGGVAIGLQNGRGPRLTPENWPGLLAAWRESLDPETLLVASIGVPSEIRRPVEVFETALQRARQAEGQGADAIHLLPPTSFRGRPERDRLVLEYHASLAEAGLPILLSYRRETLGGIVYGPEVLAQLLARPEVLGVEITTIDGISTFQQVEALTRQLAPGKWVISGEERFLGYSLMCGADGALVGMATVAPELVNDLIKAHMSADAARFLKRSGEVDTLARPIFRAPIDQAAARILERIQEIP